MSKLPMYVILSITMGIGGWIPMIWGASYMDISSIVGTCVGGTVGIWLYIKLRSAGYIE